MAEILTKSHSSRHMLNIHPKADPRNDHDEDGGNVGLHQMEANTPIQVELCSQTTVVPYLSQKLKQ